MGSPPQDLHSQGKLTCSLHGPHGPPPPGGSPSLSFSLSLPNLVTHLLVSSLILLLGSMRPCSPSSCMAHGFVGSTASSRRESETDSSGNKLHYLDGDCDHLATACRLQRTVLWNGAGTLDTGFCLGLAKEMIFEMSSTILPGWAAPE